jgi:hypothetical protein
MHTTQNAASGNLFGQLEIIFVLFSLAGERTREPSNLHLFPNSQPLNHNNSPKFENNLTIFRSTLFPYTHTETHTHTQTDTHTHTHTDTHRHTHTDTHTDTRTDTQTHTHTQTETHQGILKGEVSLYH